MQKPSVLAVMAAAMMLTALIANHAVGRLQVPKPRIVPVDQFPRQIGKWKAGEDIPVDSRIQAFIPTAKIVERPYSDDLGRTISCTLITASDVVDIHNPNICLPGQGWDLSDKRLIHMGNQAINTMVAAQDGQKYNMWYWWVGDSVGTVPGSQTISKIFKIRELIMKEHVETLSVRLFGPHSAVGDAAIQEFGAAILPHLKAITTR
jgi:EpsI family protein